MATAAAKYDGQTIEHYTIRWQADLTSKQRADIATEVERERFYPEFAWLKPSELFVDEIYQRPLSEDRVWQIATEFSWKLFDPLWVGKRGTRLYVVDGRHRLAAASILGEKLIPQVPVQVRKTQSVDEEAEIFVLLQEKRRRITSAQRFAAKLVYKDPIAVELNSLVSKYKFKIASEFFGANATSGRQNEISAVGTLEAIYRSGGRSRVSSVLQVVREAWDGKPPSTSAWMLRAINRVLEREPDTRPEAFARRLREKDAWGIIERGMRFGHSNEIPTSEAIADVLLKVTE